MKKLHQITPQISYNLSDSNFYAYIKYYIFYFILENKYLSSKDLEKYNSECTYYTSDLRILVIFYQNAGNLSKLWDLTIKFLNMPSCAYIASMVQPAW